MRLIFKPMGILVLVTVLLGLAGSTVWLLSRQAGETTASALTRRAAGTPGRPVAMPLKSKPTKVAALQKQAESLISAHAYTGNPPLNGLSYQQDVLTTFNGWQYCAYYTGTGATRYVTVARRKLPREKWETLELKDYGQTKNDEHALISMGICPRDGTIHLSFDQHMSKLQYRRSKAGAATTPTTTAWKADLFGPTQTALTGKELASVSFPRFVRAPSGALLMEIRVGAQGVGDAFLYAYDGAGNWKELGRYLDGTKENPYINGLDFDGKGRLHVTWSWRRTPDPVTNHDLCYAYSDDEGRTWKNDRGEPAGTTGSQPLAPGGKGLVVYDVPEGSELSSQESQTVDAAGRVHVLMHDKLSGDLRYVHFVRDEPGKWYRHPLPAAATPVRGQIITDAAGNAYAVLPNAVIAAATPDDHYAGWWTVFNGNGWRMDGEPLWDRSRYGADKQLSLFIRRNGTAELYALDFTPVGAQ